MEGTQEETSVVKVGDKFDEDDVSKAEQEIFPGGPTYNELEKWKSMYAGEVYLTEFDEENILYGDQLSVKNTKILLKFQMQIISIKKSVSAKKQFFSC